MFSGRSVRVKMSLERSLGGGRSAFRQGTRHLFYCYVVCAGSGKVCDKVPYARNFRAFRFGFEGTSHVQYAVYILP
jgi:hypothetical protein